jgi:hypothetical protein
MNMHSIKSKYRNNLYYCLDRMNSKKTNKPRYARVKIACDAETSLISTLLKV